MNFAIININIQIPVPENATEEEVEEIVSNYKLPRKYVEDSCEIIKVVTEGGEDLEYVF